MTRAIHYFSYTLWGGFSCDAQLIELWRDATPILVVAGMHDELYDAEYYRELFQPRSEVVLLESASHYGMLTTNALQTADSISTWARWH